MEKAGVVDKLGDPVQVDDIVGLRLNRRLAAKVYEGLRGAT